MSFNDDVAKELGIDTSDPAKNERHLKFRQNLKNLVRVSYPGKIPDDVLDVAISLVGLMGVIRDLPLGMAGTMISSLVADALSCTRFGTIEFLELMPIVLNCFSTLSKELEH